MLSESGCVGYPLSKLALPHFVEQVIPIRGTGKTSEGKRVTKIFWIVALKTTIVYDFIQHLCDTLRADPPKDHAAKKQFEVGASGQRGAQTHPQGPGS